ncbi:MAG: BMP family ABC transporter substrate-binding protein [Pseudomonadota bacterium]
MKNVSLVTLMATGLAMLLLGGCPPPPDDDDDDAIKAAWVYVSAIGDGGWTYAHNQGRLDAEASLSFLTTSFAENVPEGADATAKIRELAGAGNDIIFTTSYGYMDPTETVAAEFPDIKFEHCSGYKTAANMTNYFGRMYQARYLSGIVAGSLSPAGKIGYVAAFPIPEVIRGINAFTLGVRSVASGATVHVEWTSTWFDPNVEGAAADTLIGQGVDVMAQHQDSTAAVLRAQNAGIYAVGYDSDMASYAPNTVLTSPVWNWGPYYQRKIQGVKDGTWSNETYWGGYEDGIVGLAPMASFVPQGVRTRVETVQSSLINKTWDVFQGPFHKQDGSTWKAAGEALTDAEMLSMDAFVEGVVGTIN